MEAIGRLHAAGIETLFVTNNSRERHVSCAEKLNSLGIAASPESVVHSGDAIGSLVSPGERVILCAGEAVAEGLESQDVEIIRADEIEGEVPKADAVVISWVAEHEYKRLNIATAAVLNGARLLAPNVDPIYPTAEGMLPGSGAYAAAISYATGVDVQSAGKPSPAMAAAVKARRDDLEWMVGDQPRTDGALAELMGLSFALVHSGVTAPNHGPFEMPIAVEGADLSSVVDHVLGA